jgi:hypothetical protein
VPKPVASLATAFRKGIGEVYAIAREMLRIAATVALEVAERIGRAELVVWRQIVVPAWRALIAFLAAAIRLGEREITPARATAAVSLFAIIVLAVSQFAAYREVRAGVPAYAEVESVAGAPVVGGTIKDTGEAHAYLMLPLAALALFFLVAALRGSWRRARLLALVGLIAIVLSIVVDAPKGLDEGALAIRFEGAEARLLGGYWAQLSAGVVLLFTGPLLAAQLNPARRARARAPRRKRGPSLLERAAKRLPRGRGSRSPQGAST